MKRIARVFALTMLSSISAVAQVAPQPPDHLIPEISVISSGLAARFGADAAYIHRAFQDGYDRDVVVRAVILPAFAAEVLVGIREMPTGENVTDYKAIYLRAPGLGFFKYKDAEDAQKNGPPKPPDQVIPLRCEKPLPRDLSKRIIAAWRGVLLQTRYDSVGYLGSDGVSFHFYAWGSYQELSGWAWTPQLPTKPGMLALLADTLVSYCDGEATVADLQSQVAALEKSLKP